jgi:hypothetical protein
LEDTPLDIGKFCIVAGFQILYLLRLLLPQGYISVESFFDDFVFVFPVLVSIFFKGSVIFGRYTLKFGELSSGWSMYLGLASIVTIGQVLEMLEDWTLKSDNRDLQDQLSGCLNPKDIQTLSKL